MHKAAYWLATMGLRLREAVFLIALGDESFAEGRNGRHVIVTDRVQSCPLIRARSLWRGNFGSDSRVMGTMLTKSRIYVAF